MHTDLIQAHTSDGIALDGAFFASTKVPPKDILIDGALLIHGSAGSFYSPMNRTIAQAITNAGFPCVAFNTTAHDVAWGVPGRMFGTAYDIIDRCRLDIKAMLNWMESKGMKRIALFGHSLGAVKVVYYKALEQDPRVAALICCSPVRLSHNYFMRTEAAAEHESILKTATELIKKGLPDTLMDVKFPSPQLISARSYIDRHGPEEKYYLTRHISSITCPILFTVGTKETAPHHRYCVEDVYSQVRERPYVRIRWIEDADHVYTNKLDELASDVAEYIASLKPGHVYR